MRPLKLLLILLVCTAAVSPVWAQAAFDDADAQLRVRQAATAASEAARKVEALRKQLEAERQRVVATDGERDLNRATIKALEQELPSAEAKQREQEGALRAAQDARAKGLAAEAERRKLEEERSRQALPTSPPPPAPRQAVQPPPAPRPTAPPSAAMLATQINDAFAAFTRGDYATALRLWRPLAEQGNASAQNNLGELYRTGRGVAQDYAAAGSWYRKAAEQGEALAQTNLGFMYANGLGVAKDYAAEMFWNRKAADQDSAQAQHNLGVMYENGHGVAQDYAAAVHWYRKAAEQGLATAQFNLGLMYFNGQGVPQDNVQAHKWFNLAATQSHAKGIEGRDTAAAKMTAAQIAEAQRLAREWKPKPAR